MWPRVTSCGSAPGCAMRCLRKSAPCPMRSWTASVPVADQPVTGDVNQLPVCGGDADPPGHPRAISMYGGIIMAMTIDLKLSLVIIVAIPPFVVVITLVMRKTMHRQGRRSFDRLTLVLRENLSGIR